MEKWLLIQSHWFSHIKCSDFIYQQLSNDFDILQVTGITRAPTALIPFYEELKRRRTTHGHVETLQKTFINIFSDEACENTLFDPFLSQQFSAKKVLCDVTCAATIWALNIPDLDVIYYSPCATFNYMIKCLSKIKLLSDKPTILYQGDFPFNGEQNLGPFNQCCDFLGYLGNTDIQQRQRLTPQKLENLNIWLSFGTLITDSYSCLLNLFIELSQQWKFKLTLLLGSEASEFKINEVPENITVIKSVPNLGDILHQYDVLISHAGMNSVLEVVFAKIPILCIPFFADQYYIAEKVVEKNIGIQLFSDEIFPETIITGLTILLANYTLYLKKLDILSQSLKRINTRSVLLDALQKTAPLLK